ncbi:MAG: o-succinylbenzoate synthase [Paludibacter sp.]|jgi:o-succinylbenzoate synthase|nr:o-succinylbenzoate synthase [Paludibacter sp.]
MKARYINYNLNFKFPAGTSRGVLHSKYSAFLILEENGITGIGECSTIPGLSIDPENGYEQKLRELCDALNYNKHPENVDLSLFPSIAFGLETALLDLKTGGKRLLFNTEFSKGAAGILINGLVWMGDKAFMQKQIREKITNGYRCIKLKVGALDFETELEIIAGIREQFSENEIEIRLDANGGFSPADALLKLEKLAKLQIHSIEQPIKQGQLDKMAEICQKSPIPIVLDEELIGIKSTEKESLIEKIKPAYIILKPSLLGGFKASEEWIQHAEKQNVKWWITSALESNIGLNAIAQWTSSLGSELPQGLGTGQLYHNNIPSPLEIRNAMLFYEKDNEWDLSLLNI